MDVPHQPMLCVWTSVRYEHVAELHREHAVFTRSVLAAHCADPCQEVSKLIGSGKLGVTRTHARACLPVLSLLSPLLFRLSSSAFGAWQAACGKANHNLAHADVCIRDSDTALKSGNSPDPCCYSFKYGTQGRKAAQLCCRHTTMPCKWADFFISQAQLRRTTLRGTD